MTTRLLFPICLAFLGLRAAHAQTALPYLLSAEEANAAAEETLFPGLYTTRVATTHLAYTGQAAVRLSNQSLSSTLLPVEAGQRVTLTAYAHATPASTRRWLVPTAQVVASSLVIGTRPAVGLGLPEQPHSAGRQAFPYLSVGVALGLPHLRRSPHIVSAGASLQYRIYDQAGTFIGAGQQPVVSTSNDWQPLNLSVTVPSKGFIQIVLANAAQAPVYFDDLQAQVSPSVHQPESARQFTAPMVFSLSDEIGESEPPVTNLHINEDNGSSNPMYDPHPGEPTGPQGGTSPGPGFPGSGSSYPLPGGTVTGFPPSNPSPTYFPPVYSPGQYTPNDPPTGGGGGGSGPTPIFIPKMPGVMSPQTTNSTCVTSTMAEISKAICNPPTDENTIDHWAADKEGMSMYNFLFTPKGGVSLSNIKPLIDNFFTTSLLPVPLTVKGIQDALSAGQPIMIDIPSDASGVKHNVVITGFDPLDSNAIFYLDPLSGTTRIGKWDAMSKQADYAIPISGCK